MTLARRLTANLGGRVPDPIILFEGAGWGRPGVVGYVNAAFLRETGYKEDQVVGRPLAELLPDGEDVFGVPADSEADESLRANLRLSLADGDVKSFEGELTSLESGAAFESGQWLIRLLPLIGSVGSAGDDRRGSVPVQGLIERDEALHQSRQRLSLHVGQTPLAVIEWDLDFRVTEWNPSAERIFGYSYEDAVGRHASSLLIPPDVGEHVDEIWRQSISGRGVVRSRKNNVTKDGRQIICNWYNTPLVNGDGRVIGVASLAEDVTDRMRAEEALRDSEQRIRDFADAASDWFWEMGPDLRISYVSPRIVEMVGVPSSFFLGKKREEFTDITHNAERWAKHLEDLQARRPFKDFIYRTRREVGDGRYFRISGKPLLDADGNFAGYRGTGSDVTEETVTKAKVEAAQRQLKLAIESISEGFALYDPGDCMVLCNAKYKKLFPEVASMVEPGQSFENIFRSAIERGVYDLPEGVAIEGFIEARMRQRVEGGKQVQHLKGDRWVQVSERRTDDGGLVGVWTDITELKKHEQQAREARDAAQLANRTKSEFLANMSHELRTPLNAIIGFSEVLKGELFGPLGSAQYAEYASDIFQSGTLLLAIINDILDVSKAEAGKLELHEEQVDVAEVVRSSLRLVKDRAAESSVRLETALSDDLPRLVADERMVKQILINLLSNAVKFTLPGGRVAVTAEADEKGLKLAVRDTGIGIAPENIDKVLEPFGQVDTALNRAHQGTGLGLPLVQSLVKLHNGHLKIDSEVGVGTTVTAYFEVERVVSH